MFVVDEYVHIWESILEYGNYNVVHYSFKWFDLNRCPKEYLVFLCKGDFDW